MKKLLLLIGVFVLFAPLVHAGQYDGRWEGEIGFCRINLDNFSARYELTIKNDYATMYQYNSNSTVEIHKGKVRGFNKKNKLGLNGRWGHISGKFTSSDTLLFKYDDSKNCSVRMTKVTKSTNTKTAKNTTYCKKLSGEIYETNRGYCHSTERVVMEPGSITKVEAKVYTDRNSTKLLKELEKLLQKKINKNVNKTTSQQKVIKKKDEVLTKAINGDSFSQAVIGWRYQYAKDGYSRNLREALKWYRKAANQDQAYGLLNLGEFYNSGLGGLKTNKKTALKWFRKAAEKSNAKYESSKARYYLGLYYEKGYGGLKKDIDQALIHYKVASKEGDMTATFRVTRLEKELAKNTVAEAKVYTDRNSTKLLKELEKLLQKKINKNINKTTKVAKVEPEKTTTINKYCKTNRGTVYKSSNPCSGTQTVEISKMEYEKNKRQSKTTKVAKQEPEKTTTKKTEQVVTVVSDTTGPEIIVGKTFEANQYLTATIKGRVRDESEIALVSVDGDPVSVNKGSFSKTLFVQPGGQTVEIISMDKHGNRSTETVELKRTTVTVVTKQFDSPDPRKLIVKTNPNAVALIIGVENYENTFIAKFAKKDALAFSDFARMSLGVPQNNIKLLINEDAERIDTLKAVSKWLPKVVDENKTDLYLFFSGHGLASEDGKDLFLLPSDGDPELLEYSALMRNEIFDNIATLNPKSVTVFLDTCYSGATRSDEFLVAAKPIFIEVAEQDIPNNFTVFSASAGKETAKILKEAEHGLFSYYLMKGLEGEADTNSDKQITNGELIAFINKNVSRQANQTPQLAGDADRILVQW